jgi:hypothetical protein
LDFLNSFYLLFDFCGPGPLLLPLSEELKLFPLFLKGGLWGELAGEAKDAALNG